MALFMSSAERAVCVKSSLERLVQDRFGGSEKNAFDLFAGAAGALDRTKLESMLRVAGAGECAPIDRVADKIMDRFDVAPKDGKITWKEFETGKNR